MNRSRIGHERRRAPVVAASGIVLAALMGCAGGNAPPARTESSELAAPRAWRVIGESVQGRSIEAVTVGRGGSRVLLVGAIHGNESESLGAIDALAEALAEAPASVRIIRDLNPDGTAMGWRHNANGVDLNRNFPASNFRASSGRGAHPLSEPESGALKVELDTFGPAIVIVCHSTANGPYVNFDGPAGALAAIFADAAVEVDDRWRVVADMGYATPGSLGTYVGVDQGVPILTIEMDRGQDDAASFEALVRGVWAILEAF